MKMILCCKDCTERYLACHDHCEKYKEQRKEYEERKEKNKRKPNPRNYHQVKHPRTADHKSKLGIYKERD